MRIVFLLIFSIQFSLNLNAQTDSASENIFAIKAMPFPIMYGILYGYGVVGFVEKSISPKSSLTLGYKYLRYGFHADGKHHVMIAEYKHVLSKRDGVNSYLIPYLKYRDLTFNSQIESSVFGYYQEKSLGVGLTYGTSESIFKSNRITLDMFGGLGYFFKLDKEGRTYGRMVRPGVVPYEPGFIFHGFDLRIGALIGFNFLK